VSEVAERKDERKKYPRMIFLLLGAIAMVILAFYSLVDAYVLFQAGNADQASFSLVIGVVILVSSVSVIVRFRKYLTLVRSPKAEVMSTVECEKCGFKEIRKFRKGDYVLKTVSDCPNCGEVAVVTSIYIEDKAHS
jgi:predicted RNA-binding Zn-ribbon protein involved in translation (DUF1610 family)